MSIEIKTGATSTRHFIYSVLLATTAVLISQTALASDDPVETVVVTGTRFNPDVAPAKASLTTTQPQTIITKSYIEDSIAPTSDYVTLLAIVPSLTGLSINGPGLSDGNVKNTLRGLPDGDFGMSFDGIPFGDTNGPTHHSESYFPASTIGSVVVDRGPGNAGTIGASTYGGTISLYSEALTDETRFKQTGTAGSWATWNVNSNVQSGTFDVAGMDTRVLANFQDTGSEGFLTLQSTHHDNELLKFETDIAPSWTVTFLANRNGLAQFVNDNNGATPAQVTTFGKNFALQNVTSTKLATYFAFNPEHKETDIDYVRLQGDVSSSLHVDDQVYTYAYINKTVTTTNIAQTAADILAGKTEKLGTIVGGVPFANDVPGYTKLNAYRVWGNVLRTAFDYDLGWVNGQLRTGLWWEGSATQRARYYEDLTKCLAVSCDAFKVEKSGIFGDAKTSNGAHLLGIDGVGYLEHTGWNQFEPFMEVDIRPIENLTITPGIKYVWWQHTINPTSIVKGKPPAQYSASNPDSFTTTRLLPFATVNYRILPNWSTYFQYANGIYVPDITSFEVTSKIDAFPKPQTTTNYQLGTVYYGDNYSVDADIYYIMSDNTIQQTTCDKAFPGGDPSDTCNFNAGTVVYKGVEGEATYEFEGLLDGLVSFANGSYNSALAHLDPLNPASPTFQDNSAPFWTAASGLIYKQDGLKLSLIDKLTGQQYQDSPGKRIDKNGLLPGQAGYLGSFYKLGAYNNMDFTGSFDLGDFGSPADFEFGLGVYNVLGSRSIVSVKPADSAPLQGASVNDIANRPGSLDQYYFQPERSYEVTLKARM